MNATDIPIWITVLNNFGFPVLISLYLLIRFEKKIDKLSDDIRNLYRFPEAFSKVQISSTKEKVNRKADESQTKKD